MDKNLYSSPFSLSDLKLSITADQGNEKCSLHLDEKLIDS